MFRNDYKAHVRLQLDASDRGSLTLEYVKPYATVGSLGSTVAVDWGNDSAPVVWRLLRSQTYIVWLAFVRSTWVTGYLDRPQA